MIYSSRLSRNEISLNRCEARQFEMYPKYCIALKTYTIINSLISPRLGIHDFAIDFNQRHLITK